MDLPLYPGHDKVSAFINAGFYFCYAVFPCNRTKDKRIDLHEWRMSLAFTTKLNCRAFQETVAYSVNRAPISDESFSCSVTRHVLMF